MSEKDTSERYKAGMAVRRQVLGDAHVDRASAQMTEFDGMSVTRDVSVTRDTH